MNKFKSSLLVLGMLISMVIVSGSVFAQKGGPAPQLSCGGGYFTDVPPGSTFADAVDFVICNGFMDAPWTDSTFHPNTTEYVGKGGASKIVALATNMSSSGCSYQVYGDIAYDSNCGYINAMSVYFQAAFYPTQRDAYYCTNNWYQDPLSCIESGGRQWFYRLQPMNRTFALKLLVERVGKSITGTMPQIFEDVPSGSYGYDNISVAGYSGIVNGYPCGGAGEPCIAPNNRPYFRPSIAITRGQMAQIVWKVQSHPPRYP